MCSIQILGSSPLAKQGVTLGAHVNMNFPLRGGGGSKSVKVTGLDPSVSEDNIEEVFSAYGSISSVHLISSKVMGGLSHCFVNFDSPEDAQQVVVQMNGKVCCHFVNGYHVRLFLLESKLKAVFGDTCFGVEWCWSHVSAHSVLELFDMLGPGLKVIEFMIVNGKRRLSSYFYPFLQSKSNETPVGSVKRQTVHVYCKSQWHQHPELRHIE